MKQIGKISDSERCRIEVLYYSSLYFFPPEFINYEVIILRKNRKIMEVIILYFMNRVPSG